MRGEDGWLGRLLGANEDGQATPPLGEFTSVSSGYDHTCGVRTDGTLVCWGQQARNLTAHPEG